MTNIDKAENGWIIHVNAMPSSAGPNERKTFVAETRERALEIIGCALDGKPPPARVGEIGEIL